MLDIKFIRANPELIKAAAVRKKINFDLDELLRVDDDRLRLTGEIEKMRAAQNQASEEIVKMIDHQAKTVKVADLRLLKDKMQVLETELKSVIKIWQGLMLQVPNVPDMSVPDGDDDSANKIIRIWGEQPKFDFEIPSQIELFAKRDWTDFERGTRISGFRGYILKNEAVELSFAIWQFALQELIKRGFEPLIVPSLVRPEPFVGTGYLPQSEEDLYKTQDGDFLAGTAEVATMSYFSREIITKEMLPKKWVAFSPCFRREAGSHGKDTKGLVRVHEFYKIEQVILCEGSHEESVRWHEELLKNSEEILQALEIPYHVVINCAGDLGLGQVKKYDIESWVPSENRYRETHSASYFHDFQTRRLGIRYRDADGKVQFAHSLNNTAAATPRLLVSFVENHQQPDGRVRIPRALRPYLGGREFI